MSKMLERIKAFQERTNASRAAAASFSGQKEDIFYDFAEGRVNRIRLVGTWTTMRSHWVGPSKFNAIHLFPDSAFTGEGAIKKNLNCVDFDPATENVVDAASRECVICRLHAKVNEILVNDAEAKAKADRDSVPYVALDKKQIDFLNSIAKAAKFRERIFFHIIDRDHPEILPGKKGLKIAEFPPPLFEAFKKLAAQYNDFEFYDEKDGMDLLITKSPKASGQKGHDYSIAVATAGRGFAFTPLTDEEMAYEKPDIQRIFGRKPDQAALLEAMIPECRDLILEGDEGDSAPAAPNSGYDYGAEANGAVPF